VMDLSIKIHQFAIIMFESTHGSRILRKERTWTG
jgi:hypothetical protein